MASRAFANHREAVPPTATASATPTPSYGSATEMASGELMGPYRAGYQQYDDKGPYYPAVPGCYGGYGDDGSGSIEYGMPCASYPVLNQSPNNTMVSYQWAAAAASSSRPRQAATHGGVYVDGDPAAAAAAYPYGGAAAGSPTTSLAHRPAGAGLSGESPTSIPLSSFVSAGDRMLPTPVTRTLPSTGPYRTDGRLSSASSSSVVVPSPTASSTGVQAVEDSPPMAAYTSASQHQHPHPHSHTHHHQHHRPSYDVYHHGHHQGEAIFSEQERGMGTQGSSLDISGYTYGGSSSLRRASSATSAATGVAGTPSSSASGTLSNGQTYVPSETSSQVSPHAHHRHAHHQHHHVATSIAASPGYRSEAGGAGGAAGAQPSSSPSAEGHRGSASSRR